MRILHIIDTANPRTGGPIEGILRSSEALHGAGHHRSLATLDSPSDPWVDQCPIPLYPLGAYSALNRLRWRWLPWVRYGCSPKMISWLKAHAAEYDVVILNGVWRFTALAVRIALAEHKTPYFVFTHGMLDPWFRKTYPIKNMLKQGSWLLCEGPLLRHSRGALFTTEEERILARKAFWPYRVREFVVGYGTADVKGNAEEQERKFRAIVPRLGNRRYILFLSRIHPKKGCDLLIDAFAKSALFREGVDLVIAGPDEAGEMASLQKRARRAGIHERVHWPGMLSGDEKWGAFRGCAAFILPSHQENFGIVVAEALSCGRPVLITDKVNIWREVKLAGAGIVGRDDLEGVGGLLAQFSSMSGQQWDDMGQRARKLFLDRYVIEKNVNSLVEIIRSVV